jgi:hypothetical protein
MAEKIFSFVLMPFAREFDDIYKLGIQAVANEKGMIAERVDEQRFSESILERVYRQIKTADIIIADMTGKNPNVFYEVGYAHANDKLCILLTQSADDIPFDLKHHRHIVYGSSIHNLKNSLSGELDWALIEVEKRKSSPVMVDLHSAHGDLKDNNWQVSAEIQVAIDLHNRTKRKSPDIESIYVHSRPDWKIYQGTDLCPFTASEIKKNGIKHFIRPPLPRLSPGAWAQLKLTMKREIWNKYAGTGDKPDEYNAKGNLSIEVYTSEGSFLQDLYIDVKCDDLPF